MTPTDQGAQHPDFMAFRRQLLEAAARRDEDAVLRVIDSDVRVDFGGGAGVADFRKAHLAGPDQRQRFWRDFAWVLAHGGTFIVDGTFAAPYVYAAWPDEFDPFECLAIVGSRVRLRTAPTVRAPIVATLDYAVVEALRDDSGAETEGWVRVRAADGKTGYVAERYTRSPIDYRALFEMKNGRWTMVAYIAGD